MLFNALRTRQGDTLKTGSGAPLLEGAPSVIPQPTPAPNVPLLPPPRGLSASSGVRLRTASGMLVLRGALPLPAVRLLITGVTKDSSGAALGGCTVSLFRTADNVCLETVLSDANGNYTFQAIGLSFTYYVVAYKAGSPDVSGTTLNTLVGT